MSRVRPCPVCGQPATRYSERYDNVCRPCQEAAVCSHGERVTGYNVSLSGGFEARHSADGALCSQVTEDGTVFVRGRQCLMAEARFGGVYVEPVQQGMSGRTHT